MLNNLMAHLLVRFEDLKDREEGQGLVEYALILVLVSIIAMVALGILGVDVGEVLTEVETALNGAG